MEWPALGPGRTMREGLGRNPSGVRQHRCKAVLLPQGQGAWRAISDLAAPSARYAHTAAWTGSLMLLWGGWDAQSFPQTGGRYDPVADAWSPTALAEAPAGRAGHASVWTGAEMLVWGGFDPSIFPRRDGGRYDPAADRWRPMSLVDVPSPRDSHTAVWTGGEMIVWGGHNLYSFGLSTGGRYLVADTADADRDGVMVCGGDCDDADPGVSPSAADLPGNSVDENCDGALACDPGAYWKNHGEFVRCVVAECRRLVEEGLVTGVRCSALVSQAARSGVIRR